jgi:UDP-glucose 4-epimerase
MTQTTPDNPMTPPIEPSPRGGAGAMGAAGGRTALVTGGAGFIGSHLVERLLAGGDRVVVIDDASTGRLSNLDDAAKAGGDRLIVRTAELSATLRDWPADLPERFDEIYHLAASVGVKRVVERPIETIEVNVQATIDLLRFALERGPAGEAGAAVFIASSSEVYGKSAKLPMSEDDDCVYGPTTKQRWSYAASKAIDEYLGLAYHSQRGLPVVVARFFNTIGPRQVGTYGMVVPRFVAAAMANRPITIYGDGRQTRCFCDVRDVAPAIVALLRTPRAWGTVFNLGSDRAISIAELAESVRAALGSSSPIEKVPYDQAYQSGFEDLRDRQPDLARVRAMIGFQPAIPLEQTIRDVAAFLARRDDPASPASAPPARAH